jgi:hypothetical protein
MRHLLSCRAKMMVGFLLVGPTGTPPAFAAPLDASAICGTANEEMSQELKGNLEAKAQTFARLGTAELQGAVSDAKKTIEVGKNRSDAARELHFLNHASCMLIIQDDHLSTDEKLKRINELRVLTNVSSSNTPADLPAKFSETDATRVSAFDFQTPPQEIKPGFRKWTRVAPDTWVQLYPDGTKDFEYKVARINLYDCDGTVVSSKIDNDFQAFFPDKDCQTKQFMFRRLSQGNKWHSYVPIDHMK